MSKREQLKEMWKRVYGEARLDMLTDEIIDMVCKDVIKDNFDKFLRDNLTFEQAKATLLDKPKKGKK